MKPSFGFAFAVIFGFITLCWAKTSIEIECIDDGTIHPFSGTINMGNCQYAQVNAIFEGLNENCGGTVGNFTFAIKNNRDSSVERRTTHLYTKNRRVAKNVFYILSEDIVLWYSIYLSCRPDTPIEQPSTDVTVTFNHQCNANLAPAGGSYIYPSSLTERTVFSSYEDQYLRWTYPAYEDGACPCKDWVVQYYKDGKWTSGNVGMPCGTMDPVNKNATGVADLTAVKYGLPTGESLRMRIYEERVGFTGTYTHKLDEFYFCISKVDYIWLNYEGHPLFNFNGKIPIPLQYSGDYTRSSCGIQNNLTIALSIDKSIFWQSQVIQGQPIVYEQESANEIYGTLLFGRLDPEKSEEYKYKLSSKQVCSVQMSSVPKTSISSFKAHSNRFDLTWSGSHSITVSCGTVEDYHLGYSVQASYAYMNGTVYEVTTTPFDLSTKSATISYPSNIDKSNTVLTYSIRLMLKNAYYVISSASGTHVFCTSSRPESPKNVAFDKEYKSCDGESVSATLTWDSVNTWGVSCTTTLNRYIIDNTPLSPDVTEYPFSIDCPTGNQLVTTTKKVTAHNGESSADSAPATITVCRNRDPDQPSGMTSPNMFGDKVVVDAADGTCQFQWSHSNVWGNCLPSETPSDPFFEVFEEDNNGQLITPAKSHGSESSAVFSVSREGDTNRYFTIKACRTLASCTFSRQGPFKFCFPTAPSAPSLTPFSENPAAGTVNFKWEASETSGEGCMNPEPTVTYTLIVVDNDNIEVCRKETTGIEENCDLQDKENQVLRWYVTASIKVGDVVLENSSSSLTVMIGTNCNPVDPKWNDNDEPEIISPANNTRVVAQSGSEIAFSWKEPKQWGLLCAPSTSRKVVFSYKNTVNDDSDRLIKDETSSLSLPLTSGDYEWSVLVAVVNLENTDENSTIKTPLIGKFSACFFTVPELIANYSHVIIAEEGQSYTISYYISDAGYTNDNTCGEKITVSYILKTESSNVYTCNKTFDSVEELKDFNATFSYTPSQSERAYVYADVTMSDLPPKTSSETIIIDLCLPRTPDSPRLHNVSSSPRANDDVILTVDEVNISASNCNNETVVAQYTFTVFNESDDIVFAEQTSSTSVTAHLDTGSYSVSVSCFNGYHWSVATTSQIDVCVKKEIKPVSLKYPLANDVPYYMAVEFQYSNLSASDYPCADASYKLWYWNKEDENSKAYLNLSSSEDDSSYTAYGVLKSGISYCWLIETIAFGESVNSTTICFDTCTPTLFNETGISNMHPRNNQTKTAVEGFVTLSWDLPQNLCGASLVQSVRYWLDNDTTILSAPVNPFWNNVTVQVTGGLYFWQVLMQSPELGMSAPNDTIESFVACNERLPSSPTPVKPEGYALRRNLVFTVNYGDPGEYCLEYSSSDSESNEFDPPGYIAELSLFSGGFSKNFSIPITSVPNSLDQLTIAADNTGSIQYGTYKWDAVTINEGGRWSRSDSKLFVLCDEPLPVSLISPVNGSNLGVDFEFTWEYTPGMEGFSCTGRIYSSELVFLIDDVEEMKKSNAIVPQKNAAHWIIRNNVPTSLNASVNLGDTFEINHTYAWCLMINTSATEYSLSEIRYFTISENDCRFWQCLNGGTCNKNETLVFCSCQSGYTGDHCEEDPPINLLLILCTTIPAFLLIVIIILIIVAVAIKKRKKEARTKVLLKAPDGDLRFTHVKPADVPVSGKMRSETAEKLRADAEAGDFAWSMAILASTPSTAIENTVKAMLYAHHANKTDVEMLKHVISYEVNLSKSAKVIFRANTAATLMFKHFSKMVGMGYLFKTLGKILQDVMQKDADDAATEDRVKKDKKLVDLMVMQDTCEVDPTKLAEDGVDDDEMLSVNVIQLTLLVQRFLKHIFHSSSAIPDDLREVIAHIRNEVSKKFPDATQRALSAFLFLRFYNCAIAIPEAYGLLKNPPNSRVRRSLVLVTKVLTTMASGAHFGDKESFMTQFNDLIDKNQNSLKHFYDRVCDGTEAFSDDSEKQTKVQEVLTVPSKLLDDSLSVLAASSQSLDENNSAKSTSD